MAEEYRARFKETESPKLAGIAVLTDADDTKSRAAGDYANFQRLPVVSGQRRGPPPMTPSRR